MKSEVGSGYKLSSRLAEFLSTSDDWSEELDLGERSVIDLLHRVDRHARTHDLPVAFLESGDTKGTTYLFAGRSLMDVRIETATAPRADGSSPDLEAMRREWADRIPSHSTRPLHPSAGAGVGFLSYDFARSIEHFPATSAPDIPVPAVHFFFPSLLISLDHVSERVTLSVHRVSLGREAEGITWHGMPVEDLLEPLGVERNYRSGPAASEIPTSLPDHYRTTFGLDEFSAVVDRAREYIEAGDTFQVNLSIRASRSFDRDPLDLYRALRRINPSPYMSYLSLGDLTVVGASPEQLVRRQGRSLMTRPIAGTRRRGRDSEEGALKEAELLGSEKERAEHLMLVDLERNDLGRIATFGSVTVDEFMTIERYSHVMHIVSNVTAELAEGRDSFDVIRAMFPGGTITGAPKVRSMKIIDELEPVARGVYTGSVGWIAPNGDMEFNIAIRSILLHDGEAHVQAGAGIVFDSVGEHEYRESLKKMAAAIDAIEQVAGERGA